jgi:hypothetical protein
MRRGALHLKSNGNASYQVVASPQLPRQARWPYRIRRLCRVFTAPSPVAVRAIDIRQGMPVCPGTAALRHGGTAAMRHCGTAALRYSGTAVLRYSGSPTEFANGLFPVSLPQCVLRECSDDDSPLDASHRRSREISGGTASSDSGARGSQQGLPADCVRRNLSAVSIQIIGRSACSGNRRAGIARCNGSAKRRRRGCARARSRPDG